jgi:hypothetical protein
MCRLKMFLKALSNVMCDHRRVIQQMDSFEGEGIQDSVKYDQKEGRLLLSWLRLVQCAGR